eukprot:TRINITY_DN10523_c0_g2_i1.p1 TRINITY_DN10523_c0_g2~~TRINITY_DN10523_c0_g2_i1.p1  ORF type:complete len:820 (+),score=131.75 TRINITY_DN10523_c0_g2_i1:194-2653(+)
MASGIPDTLADALDQIVDEEGRRLHEYIPSPGSMFTFSSRIGLYREGLPRNITVPNSSFTAPLWHSPSSTSSSPSRILPADRVPSHIRRPSSLDHGTSEPDQELSQLAESLRDPEEDPEDSGTVDLSSSHGVDGPVHGDNDVFRDSAYFSTVEPSLPTSSSASKAVADNQSQSGQYNQHPISSQQYHQDSESNDIQALLPSPPVNAAASPLVHVETEALLDAYGLEGLFPLNWTGTKAKVAVPRTIMAKLANAHGIFQDIAQERAELTAKDIEHDEADALDRWHHSERIAQGLCDEVDAYLRCQSKPWAKMGSSHPMHSGDYDFCSVVLAYVILRHGPLGTKLLSSDLCEHVSTNLLPEVTETPSYRIPNVRLVHTRDTENHLLMINATLCLHHAYKHPKHALPAPLDAAMVHLLMEVRERGLWEFNSRPYTAYYTMTLLILEEVAPTHIALLAHQVLDMLTFAFALGTSRLRRNDPFRRRLSRAKSTDLYDHPMSALMAVWLQRAGITHPDLDDFLNHRLHQTKATCPADQHAYIPHLADGYACYAALFRYTPPDITLRLAWDYGNESEHAGKNYRGYYARLGHGNQSCPEVYTRTRDWLLAGGGAATQSHIVARPIALIWTKSLAVDRKQLLHIYGTGHFSSWSMTGVIFNVAVARGFVHIPIEHYRQIADPFQGISPWEAWRPREHHDGLVLVHRGDGEAHPTVVMVYSEVAADQIAFKLLKTARESNNMLGEFGKIRVPDDESYVCDRPWAKLQSVEYDLTKDNHVWPITGINGNSLRHCSDYDTLPLFDLHGDSPVNVIQLPQQPDWCDDWQVV